MRSSEDIIKDAIKLKITRAKLCQDLLELDIKRYSLELEFYELTGTQLSQEY